MNTLCYCKLCIASASTSLIIIAVELYPILGKQMVAIVVKLCKNKKCQCKIWERFSASFLMYLVYYFFLKMA